MFFKTLGTFLHLRSFGACTHKPIPADNFIKYNTNTVLSYSSLQSACIVVLIRAYVRCCYDVIIFLFNSYFGFYFQDADSRTRFCVIFYEIVGLYIGFVYDRRYYGKYSENLSSKQEIDTNYNMPFIHEEFIKNEENPGMFQRK